MSKDKFTIFFSWQSYTKGNRKIIKDAIRATCQIQKEKYGYDCFADDTGLQVEALNGEPGVYSARYAGEPADSERNINKLLANLEGIENRKASFVTCIALVKDNKEYVFYGEIVGKIIEERRGTAGFGYDSVFVPEGYDETFAQMGENEKNKISHRAKAVKKLSDFFNTL